MTKRIKALFNAEQYHGWNKTKNYFEGWYYKVVSKDEKHAFAIIPGIAMGDKNKHAFIQVLDGKKRTSTYHRFSANDFIPQPGIFKVKLGKSFFAQDSMKVDLPFFKADLKFENQVPWPSTILSPNIMGPFTFVPFMQCYHGILSMDHAIKGKIIYENKEIDFSGGKGYMEKDWGRSFPSAYIWMQSNHFSCNNISIKSSVAKIPWLGSYFIGFIAGIYLRDQIIQFTTYNFSKLQSCKVDKENVFIKLENPKYHLEIHALRNESTELAAPIMGFMDGRIEESMEAEIKIILRSKKTGEIILQDLGKNAGLEVAGKIEEILT